MSKISLKSLDQRIIKLEEAHKAALASPKLAKGEIDVGFTLHEGKPARLILLPESAQNITWDDAKAWAKKLGAELPTRVDALLLWERHKDLGLKFETDRPYWTSEQYAGDASYAWYQWFGYGGQGTWLKSYKRRACAVRRVLV